MVVPKYYFDEVIKRKDIEKGDVSEGELKEIFKEDERRGVRCFGRIHDYKDRGCTTTINTCRNTHKNDYVWIENYEPDNCRETPFSTYYCSYYGKRNKNPKFGVILSPTKILYLKLINRIEEHFSIPPTRVLKCNMARVVDSYYNIMNGMEYTLKVPYSFWFQHSVRASLYINLLLNGTDNPQKSWQEVLRNNKFFSPKKERFAEYVLSKESEKLFKKPLDYYGIIIKHGYFFHLELLGKSANSYPHYLYEHTIIGRLKEKLNKYEKRENCSTIR